MNTLQILKYVWANITNSYNMNAGASDQETASPAALVSSAASASPGFSWESSCSSTLQPNQIQL